MIRAILQYFCIFYRVPTIISWGILGMRLLSRTMWLISVMCVKSTAASTLSSLFVQNETGQSRGQSRILTQFGNLWRRAVNKKQFGQRTIQDARPGLH